MKAFTLMTGALALCLGNTVLAEGHVQKASVLETYANIAKANYADSLITAGSARAIPTNRGISVWQCNCR
jgi:putative iron-regulated protein